MISKKLADFIIAVTEKFLDKNRDRFGFLRKNLGLIQLGIIAKIVLF